VCSGANVAVVEKEARVAGCDVFEGKDARMEHGEHSKVGFDGAGECA
jgi:hypothetical protein